MTITASEDRPEAESFRYNEEVLRKLYTQDHVLQRTTSSKTNVHGQGAFITGSITERNIIDSKQSI